MIVIIGDYGTLGVYERRETLLALIGKYAPRRPITTKDAQLLHHSSPWIGIGRNAARRDLRDLARRGQLTPTRGEGRQAYLLNHNPPARHPVTHARAVAALTQAIAAEDGEWTPGRAKVVLRRAIGTHVYRSVAWRHLDSLHRDGLLELHSEQPGRCYYTSLIEGGGA